MSVENGLSRLTAGCLDIAFREDESRVLKGHAPENLALLRRIEASLIKQDVAREAGVSACRKKIAGTKTASFHLLRLI